MVENSRKLFQLMTMTIAGEEMVVPDMQSAIVRRQHNLKEKKQ